MRIAVGGIWHETNTFSTLRTQYSDFRIWRGQECIQAEAWNPMKAVAELLPCLTAGATPNGLVPADVYLALKDELLERLKAQLPFDGLFLPLHGAMHVEEIGDGETDLVRTVRALVGPDMPIASNLDLHGNLSPEFVASVNILTALRTAPHIDGLETRQRAFDYLVRAITENRRPVTAMVKLPLLLPGEYAVTAIEPSKSLYAHIEKLKAQPGVWDASLMISCAWTDSPFTSVSTLVVADDLETASKYAQEYADMVWERRKEFGAEVETIAAEAAIQKAASSTAGPLFISESGDNVTAGGAGDVPVFLEMLIQAGLDDTLYAGIADPAAVKTCEAAGVGAMASLSLGGKLDAVNAKPLEVQAKVLKLTKGIATVEVGGISIVITSGRDSFHTLESFEPTGIDPLKKRVVVVKQGYLAPPLKERCSETIMALTAGFTDLRIETLPYRNVVRPIYPLDDI